MFIFIDHPLQPEIAKNLICFYEIQLKLLIDYANFNHTLYSTDNLRF